jgi:hypothetical protein
MPSSVSRYWPEHIRRTRDPVSPQLPTPPSTQPIQSPTGTPPQLINSSVQAPISFSDEPSGLVPQAHAKRSLAAFQYEPIPSTLLSPPSSNSFSRSTAATPKFGPLPPLASSTADTSRFHTTVEDDNEDDSGEDGLRSQAQAAERQRRLDIARGKQRADAVEQAQGDGYLTWQGQEETRSRAEEGRLRAEEEASNGTDWRMHSTSRDTSRGREKWVGNRST